MPTAEIIAIGTELLLGEIQDTNTAYMARTLRDYGINLYRTMIIGDNYQRIGNAIREACTRADIIITTGGLGPTIDDATRQAVAFAFDEELEFRQELWEQILERYTRYNRPPTENNKRQAYIPKSAVGIENPVGTAPAFYIDSGKNVVISLPGVPREMETLLNTTVLPFLHERFQLNEVIKAYVLHASGVGESQVDEWISDLETLENPTVGLLAYPGQVDIRITARANTYEEADRMVAKVADDIRSRVGNAIFGVNEEKLEQILIKHLNSRRWSLCVVESGLDEIILNKLAPYGITDQQLVTIPSGLSEEDLIKAVKEHQSTLRADVTLGILFTPGSIQQNLYLFLSTPEGNHEIHRSYGGPPQLSANWATAWAFDYIRRNIL